MSQQAFYQSLSRKRMSAGAVFWNESSEYLLVKPGYKDYWQLAGGAIDENESPLSGCIREVREELGLSLANFRLICADYIVSRPPATEGMFFIFYGGVLHPNDIDRIVLQESELTEFRFFTIEEAREVVNERMCRRLNYCDRAIREETFYYLEKQEPICPDSLANENGEAT